MIVTCDPDSSGLSLLPDTETCVTIGNFDGVHCGHQALLELTRLSACQSNRKAAAITFAPHPLEVLTSHAPPRLGSTSTRLELLEKAGMDLVVLLRFTPELAAMTPEHFVCRILLDGLHMRDLFLGHDFCLGRNRAGTPEHLTEMGKVRGFTVTQMPAFSMNGTIVSSTRIRELLQDGDVQEAALLLGRLYSIRGQIVYGCQRGRILGFPTANLVPDTVMLPKSGVYATLVGLRGTTLPEWPAAVISNIVHRPEAVRSASLDGKKHSAEQIWPAVTNVGYNPTFGGSPLRIETHLFDFSGDLYGTQLEIAFVQRLRDEMRFPDSEALKAQICRDRQQAAQLLGYNTTK